METKNLKPFDLEAAKAGAPVVTRNGCQARIICTDLRCGKCPIVAAVMSHDEESVEIYSVNGELYCKARNGNDLDLFMAPIKRKGWVNLRRICDDVYGAKVYETKEKAESVGLTYGDYVATVPVEWKE